MRRGNFHIYVIRKSDVTKTSSKRTYERRALERSNQNLNRAATKEDTTPATKEDVTLAMHPSSNTPFLAMQWESGKTGTGSRNDLKLRPVREDWAMDSALIQLDRNVASSFIADEAGS